MNNVTGASVYTDFNALGDLKREARQESPEALNQAAKQFESLFLNMVFKNMREAKLAEGVFDNDQTRFFMDMHDQQLALHLANEGGIG
ncbi:MAG: rod-binding protein, partial [Gammaproteobacteria bacterium]